MDDQSYESLVNLVESIVSRVSEIPHMIAVSKPKTAAAYARSSRREIKDLVVLVDLMAKGR